MSESKYVAFAMPQAIMGTRAEARNLEIKRCLKMNPKYIFMIDSDQTMPIEAWTALVSALKVSDADVAVVDTPPHDSNVVNITYSPDGTIAFCSIACALFKASVFERLPYPWFSSMFNFQPNGTKDGKIVFSTLEKYQDDNQGEDIYFVRNALQADMKIEYITKMKCAHYRL